MADLVAAHENASTAPISSGQAKRYLFYIAGDIRRIAGNARVMLSLAEAVRRRGHTVSFVAQAWGPGDEYREVDAPLDASGKDAQRAPLPFEVIWLEPDQERRRWFARLFRAYQIRLLRPLVRRLYMAALAPLFGPIFDRERPDAVVTCSCSLIYFNEALAVAARECEARFAVLPLCHFDTGENTGPRFIRLFQRADLVPTFTRLEADWLVAHGVSARRARALGAAADYAIVNIANEASLSETDMAAHDRIVLFLGRKVRTKGYQHILQAMAQVWGEFPDTHFVFVGPREADWDADSAPFRADERVTDIVAGDAERADWLRRCSVLCVPSTAESFGMIYTEAWLFRKPVIAANIAVTRELIGDSEGGLIVEPTANAVAHGILSLLRDPALSRRLGENGWRATQTTFNWDRIAGDLDGRVFGA
jgi:glycosyltransferase involved in cell wall biosynthesis